MAKESDQNLFKTHTLTESRVIDKATPMDSGLDQVKEVADMSHHDIDSPPESKKSKNNNEVESDQKEVSSDSVTNDDIQPWMVHSIGSDQNSFYSMDEEQEILEYLSKLGLLNDEQRNILISNAQLNQVTVLDQIIEQKILSEKEVGTAIAPFFNCTFATFKGVSIPENVIGLIPKSVSEKNGVVVFEVDDEYLKVAMVNPRNLSFIHLLQKKIGKKIKIYFTTFRQIKEALKSYSNEFEGQIQTLMARASENISHLDTLTNISQVFDSLVLMAFQREASDVHIEPLKDQIRIRFRIDGVLRSITTLPSDFLETVINHIKVLAKLKTDTHNASQDGRFHVTYDTITINFRVSIMPSHYGEKAVLRLLTSETQEWSLSELGYRDDDQVMIEKAIGKTNGMILCCGPTGSGKTTTLYAILKQLNKEGVNISTIEDPIEYGLSGIVQSQVNAATNITYVEGLKSLMRQDPDILMIGEIRDFETGKITVNAALTGHLVLSTLHTNSASLAPLRLLQMSVDPYLIVNTVHLIIAQRLVRKICSHCLTSYAISNEDLLAFSEQFGLGKVEKELFQKHFPNKKEGDIRLFKGQGCEKCGGTGFKGRMVIAEVLKMEGNIRQLIIDNASEADIEEAARKNGMQIMFEDGLVKVKEGVTTLEEVFRVINQ